MRKWLIAAAVCVMITLISLAMPFQGRDVAQLIPVEALVVSVEEGTIILDAGDCRGSGETWEAAWEDLHRGAPGTVFLNTADYVVLTGSAVGLLETVVWDERLRPAAALYGALGETPDPKETASYLNGKQGGPTIQQLRADLMEANSVKLPLLVETEGGLRLYER